MNRPYLLGISLALVACNQLNIPSSENRAQSSTATILSSSGPMTGMTVDELVGEEEATPVQNELEKITVEERLLSGGILEIGSVDAPLTLTVFTEHHCSYCHDFVTEQLPMLITDFIQKNELRVQIVILPLQKYPRSEAAARALYCAGKQGKGLPMHELLFGNSVEVASYVNILELESETFTLCSESSEAADSIAKQKALAGKNDVALVPTFILNGHISVGLPYYADLRGQILKALSNQR